MAGKEIFLVRHGDTCMNAGCGPERERGWSDVPLDAEGRKEAMRIAAKLSRLGVKSIVSSNLKRARQTAEIVGDHLGIVPQFEAGLRTWNTGDLAGRLKRDVEPVLARLVRDNPDEAPKGGESFDRFCSRVRACLGKVLAAEHTYPLALIIHNRVERLIDAAEPSNWQHVDAGVFLSKGEEPGHIEKWTNPSVPSSASPKSRKVSGSIAAHASTSRAGNATTPISNSI